LVAVEREETPLLVEVAQVDTDHLLLVNQMVVDNLLIPFCLFCLVQL
jgi:hypothetical protein